MYEGFQKNMSGTALHDYRRILHVLSAFYTHNNHCRTYAANPICIVCAGIWRGYGMPGGRMSTQMSNDFSCTREADVLE